MQRNYALFTQTPFVIRISKVLLLNHFEHYNVLVYTRGITVKGFEVLISLGDVFNPNSLHDKLKKINQNCADIVKQYCEKHDIELNTDDAPSSIQSCLKSQLQVDLSNANLNPDSEENGDVCLT